MIRRDPSAAQVRDMEAGRQARQAYALSHDHFAELEQLLVSEGRVPEATGAHEFARIALRAYRAELDDPEPIDWTRAQGADGGHDDR